MRLACLTGVLPATCSPEISVALKQKSNIVKRKSNKKKHTTNKTTCCPTEAKYNKQESTNIGRDILNHTGNMLKHVRDIMLPN